MKNSSIQTSSITFVEHKVATNYFPKLLYFFQLTKLGALIEGHENYVKGSDRNRCQILSDKAVERLSVPVKKDHGNKMPIQKTGIDYSEKWNIKHLRAIRSYYGSAPYFEYYWDSVEAILSRRYDNLFELNTVTTLELGKMLGLKMELKLTTDFCRNEAPSDGFVHPEYYQVFSEKMDFVEGLSGLDYLFCEGKIDSYFDTLSVPDFCEENLVLNQRGIISAPIIK